MIECAIAFMCTCFGIAALVVSISFASKGRTREDNHGAGRKSQHHAEGDEYRLMQRAMNIMESPSPSSFRRK